MRDPIHDIIVVSELVESDREHVAELYVRSVRETFTWFDGQRIATVSFDRDTEGEFILVARARETIVGFASLWLPDSFIHHLYVDVRWKNQGIGKQLLFASIQKLDGAATLKCLTKNQSAVNFYTKNGALQRWSGESEDGEYVLFEWSAGATSD